MAEVIVPAVYKTIAAVSAELAKDGISKSRKNAQQGYSFRGIDEVLNALAPVLTKHGLVILPRCLSRTCTERETKSGGTMFSVVVEAEFDFVAASDGTKHTIKTYGEAMDSGDKATNKAMSAAYKYAAFQAFCIPTEGDNDADAQTPEPVKRSTITVEQAKKLFDLSEVHGWKAVELKALVKRVCGVEQSSQIPASRFDELCAMVQRGIEAGAKA